MDRATEPEAHRPSERGQAKRGRRGRGGEDEDEDRVKPRTAIFIFFLSERVYCC
jgi:hypothetical protein